MQSKESEKGIEMPEFYEEEVLERLHREELSMLKDFIKICDTHKLEYFGIAGTGIGAIRHGGFIPWDDDIDLAMPRKDFEKFIRIIRCEWKDKYYILNNKTNEQYPLMTTRFCKCDTVFQERPLKDLNCPFGIFLDLYVLDNVADDEKAYKRQAWEAWFWSKMLVLSCVPKPYLFQKGWKAQVIWAICGVVHHTLKALHIRPALFRAHCESVCRRYEGKKTRRMAFLPDTNPFWNVIDKTKMYPLRKLQFEDTWLNFVQNLEENLTNQYGDYMTLPDVENRKTHFSYRLKFEGEDEKTSD